MSSLGQQKRILPLLARYSNQASAARPLQPSMMRSASSLTTEPNTSQERQSYDNRRRRKQTSGSSSPSSSRSAAPAAAWSDSWVPAAYRGAQKESPHHGSSSPSSHRNRSSGRPSRSSRAPRPLLSKEEYVLEKDITIRQKRHGELMDLAENTLLRLAGNYQRSLVGRKHPPHVTYKREASQNKNSSNKRSKNKSKHAADLARLEQDMTQTFDSMQSSSRAATTTLATIQATEDLYRGICRALQQTIESSVALATLSSAIGERTAYLESRSSNTYDSRQFAQEAALYVNLAENSFLTLAKLQSGRAQLTASLVDDMQTNDDSNTDDKQNPDQQASPEKGFFRSVISFFLGDDNNSTAPSSSTVDEKESPILEGTLAHEDPNLAVTQALLSLVLRAMNSLVVAPAKDGPVYSSSPLLDAQQQLQQEKYQIMAQHMVALLEVMPSNWKSTGTETLELVMEMQCRVGSLDSARACLAVWQKYSHPSYQMRFALVLQAYLGAVLHETEDETRLLAATEAAATLHHHWDGSLPRHHVERVFHASIILNCLSVADRIPIECSTETSMQEQAHIVMKRTLGGKGYFKLMMELQSPTPLLDYLSLPLINYMVHLYASSGDSNKLTLAKATLVSIMSNGGVGVGRIFVYPIVETANAVLRSIAIQYENKAKADWGDLKSDEDLTYALQLLDDMLHRRESTSWPNADTFEIMFRLLMAVKPVGIGEHAEQLLAKMEIRNIFSPDYPIPISLSTYHRVLRCWLEAAKLGAGHDACDRALKILNKLDVQSNPLLLSDTESRMQVASNLYNIFLRPTRQTYKLILQTCLEVRNEDAFEKALSVATEAYTRMESSGIVSDKEAAKRLAECRNRVLPKEAKRTNTISSETLNLLSNSKQEAL